MSSTLSVGVSPSLQAHDVEPGTTSNKLSKILEQANQLKNLTKSNQTNILKNLGELRNTTLSLAEKSALGIDPSVKNRANLLLAKKGIDTEKLDRKLAEVDLKTTESTPFLAHTDLEKFLSQNHEMILISAIEESKHETEMRFARSCADKLHNEWSSTKMEYLQELGQREYWGDSTQPDRFTGRVMRTPTTVKKASSYPTPSFPNPPQVQPSPYSSLFETVNDKKRREFSGVVTKLIEGLKNNKSCSLVEMFMAAISRMNLEKTAQSQLLLSWQALSRIIGKEPHQFSEILLKNSNQAREFLLKGVRAFLEDQFTSYMYEEVRNSPESSRIGQKDIVEAFVKIKSKREFQKNDDWMIIYYYFRIGQLDESIRFAKERGLSDASILEDFKKHSSSSHFQQGIKTKYMELESQENTSPFKLLMFNIMGICDLSKNFGAIMPKWTCYDFIWQQVIQIGSVGDNTKLKASAALRELQDRVTKKLGPKTFNQTGKDPLTYFQILLLTLQFERAIDYLMNFEESFQFDAVHFAVTLYYSDLLNQPSLYYENPEIPSQRPTLNYSRLLRSFVENLNDPLVGVKYYCTLRDERARNECIRDLAVKTGQYTQIFGEVDLETGQKNQGILFSYLRPDEVADIMKITADAYERMGCHEEALKLYDLAQDFEKMLKLLNKQLSRAVTTMDGNSREMVEYAKKRCDRSGAWSTISEQTRRTFDTMSNLAIFFDLYHYGRFADALSFNQDFLKLLPFRSDEVSFYLKEFGTLDDAVRKNFATLLVDTMTCVLRIYEQAKATSSGAMDLQKLKDCSVALVAFAGKNQGFYMSGDTHAKLTKMDMQIIIR